MARPRKSTASKRVPRKKAGSRTNDAVVKVRMYNVGFGDCFLMFVPTDEGDKKILIDCGTFKAGPRLMKDVVGHVIEDIRDGNGGDPRVDIVIATHRHKDHIIGFADPRWNNVSVGEVWLPWTEHPSNREAREVRESQERYVEALHSALERRKEKKLAVSLDLMDFVLNSRTNGDALHVLHNGFKGSPKRRYLPRRDDNRGILTTGALPGVTVHVLGPSYDDVVRRAMDPKPGEAYLTALEADAAGEDEDAATYAFGWEWAIPDDSRDDTDLFEHLKLSDGDIKAVKRHASERDWEYLAARGDEALNNTSLILMFQIGTAHLLFPGDAQWGPWQALLSNAYHRDPRLPLLDEIRKITDQVIRSDDNVTPVGCTRKRDIWSEVRIPIESPD
jgi:Metallo-beta-lactamase superfamily